MLTIRIVFVIIYYVYPPNIAIDEIRVAEKKILTGRKIAASGHAPDAIYPYYSLKILRRARPTFKEVTMSKNKKGVFTVISLVMLTLLGVSLILVIQKTRKEFAHDVKIEVDGNVRQTMSVSLTGFVPGAEKEYAVLMTCTLRGEYSLRLVWEETGDGELDKFLYAAVFLGDELQEERPLTEYLSGRQPLIKCKLKKIIPTRLVIRFKMPYEVGNEAMKTVTDFKLTLEINKEEA